MTDTIKFSNSRSYWVKRSWEDGTRKPAKTQTRECEVCLDPIEFRMGRPPKRHPECKPVWYRKYVQVFLEHNGEGPWPCTFCTEDIYELGRGKELGVVHHLDHDRTNHSPDNLDIAHLECHSRHHIEDRPWIP